MIYAKPLRAAALAAMFVALAVGGGAVVGGVAHAATESEVKRLIDEAETLRKQAAELEFEWRFTKQRIKDAREALKAGKLDEAEKHAARAKREGELAIEQAATADKVWEIAVPK